MKKISITYNPYKLTTTIIVDGKKPKQNSSLNIENRRLQEWVDKLPDIMVKEYPDNNYDIHFTGTQVDYDDLTAAFNDNQDYKVKFEFDKKGDAETVEKAIDEIFREIEEGPVAEMRDKRIKEAFEKAKNQQFEINVIATMSAGKSTLINALLGKKLMPIGNQATTATIVKILDKKGQKEFSAKAFDQNHKMVKQFPNVTYQDMVSLNANANVSSIEIQGDIPFVKSDGMRLVLIDTPGPNNSRDKQHEKMTYRMLENSDKSLVLFVINGRQVGIKDEQDVLSFVCETMDKGGKQSRERYIFAANQMDAYDIEDEGIGCIDKALNEEKDILKGKGIINPNIFPVASRPALEARTKDPKRMTLNAFENNATCSDVYHFEKYYHFSHLPQKAKIDIERWIDKASDSEKIEIHTGIVSIEQAINQYVNKYARTTKVNDLVQSFDGTLKELATISKIEEAIRKDKNKKAKLAEQIKQIQKNIETAKNAKTVSAKIDAIDLMKKVEEEAISRMTEIRKEISSIITNHNGEVEKSEAEKICANLEKKCKALPSRITVKMESVIDDCYKKTLNSILEEYKNHLKDLNMGISANALNFNPMHLVLRELEDLSGIIEDNTIVEDQSYTVKESYQKRVEGGFFRKAANILTFGWVDDHTWETAYRDKVIKKYVDKVNLKDVAIDYLSPIREGLDSIEKQTIEHAKKETNRLKEILKKKLVEIEAILYSKMEDLTKTSKDQTLTEAAISQKESNLEWLESIQQRVDNLVEFK